MKINYCNDTYLKKISWKAYENFARKKIRILKAELVY